MAVRQLCEQHAPCRGPALPLITGDMQNGEDPMQDSKTLMEIGSKELSSTQSKRAVANYYPIKAACQNRAVYGSCEMEVCGDCKVCCKVVTARQHALERDNCQRWVHRLCGTGISYTQYRGIMDNLRHGGTFPWICESCTADA